MRTFRFVLATALATLGLSIIGAPPAGAAASVGTFDQCERGTPNTQCSGYTGGNLISGYNEDQVVPQRVELNVTSAGSYTFTTSYDDLSGSSHIIDYLASYDYTVTNAQPCLGYAASICAGTPSTFDIPTDTAARGPVVAGYSNIVADHELDQADRQWTLYGGTITGSTISHGSGTGIASVTFTTTGAGTAILMYGAHLALTGPATTERAWPQGASTKQGNAQLEASIGGAKTHNIKVGTATPPPPPAAFTIEKTATPTTAGPGDQVSYSVKVTNTGGLAGTATFTDNYNDNLTSVSTPAGCTPGAGAMTCTTNSLAPGASQTFSYTANLPVSFPGSPGGDPCTPSQFKVSNTATFAAGTNVTTGTGPATADVCVDANASFTVSKSVSGSQAPNGGLTYVVTVKNTGTASGSTTWSDNYDDRLIGVSNAVSASPAGNDCAPITSGDRHFGPCNTGNLAPGASQTFTYTATVPSTFSGSTGGGTCSNTQYQFRNTATVPGASDAVVDVCISAAAAFTVTKTVSDDTAIPGQTVTYTITIKNTGIAAGSTTWSDNFEDSVTDVSDATSDNVDGTTCVPGAGAFTGCQTVVLLAGGEETFTYTAKMPSSFTGSSGGGDCDPGSYPVANTATTGNSSSSKTVCVGAAANFSIVKTASTDSAVPGQTVTYTIKVKNEGQAPGSTSFTDDYDNALSPTLPTSATVGASCTQGSGSFDCSTGEVNPGVTVTFTYTAEMPDSFGPVSGSDNCEEGSYEVSNTATLGSGPASTAFVCVAASPAFTIDKSVSPEDAGPGDEVTYTVVVHNNGDAAGATSFTDNYDDRLTPSDPSVGHCQINGGPDLSMTCTTEVIAAHSSQTFTYTATLPTTLSGDTGGGTCADDTYRFANTATLENEDDASAQVCVTAAPNFTISKAVSNNTPMPGETVTYTITVSNTGNAAGSTTFTDDFDTLVTPTVATSDPGGNNCTAAGGKFDCTTGVIPALDDQTFSYDVTIPETFEGDAGTDGCGPGLYAIKNTVELTGAHTDAEINTDAVLVCVGASPKFEVTKTADDTTVSAGDTVNYTITVKNIGNASGSTDFVDDYAEGLDPTDVVSDPAGADCDDNGDTITCTTADLVAGDSQTFKYSADMPDSFTGDSGGEECGDGSYPVINTVTIAGDGGDSDGVKVCVSAAPDLVVDKSVDDDTVAAGDTVTYTITVHNQGTAPGATTFTDDYAEGLVLTDRTESAGISSCTDDGDTLECTTGTLNAGASATVTYKVVMPSDFDGDDSGTGDCLPGEFPVLNGVTLEGSEADDTVTVCVTAAPEWDVTKTADAEVTTPGATIEYVVTVKNIGSASGVTTWSDDFDDRLTPTDAVSDPAGNDCTPGAGAFVDCPTGEIGAGDQQTFTYSAVLPDTFEGDRGEGCGDGEFAIHNSATTASGATAGSTVCVDASAQFRITKTVDDEDAEPGQTVNYEVTVENIGAASGSTSFDDHYDPRLSPTLPVSDPEGGTCEDVNGVFHCETGDIPGHGQMVFTYSAELPDTFGGEDGTDGCADGEFAVTNTVTTDEGPGDSQTVCVAASPDLVVTKTASKTDALPGDVIEYTITVTNNGHAIGSTDFTDDYDNRLDPTDVVSDRDGPPCLDDGDTITCHTAPLGFEESQTFTYSVTLPDRYTGPSGSDDCDEGTYPVFNRVLLASGDETSETVCVTAAPSVTVIKSSTLDTTSSGAQFITYTIGFTNLGDAEATPVTLTDAIPNGTAFESCTGDCTTGGTNTATWDIGSIAPKGGSGSVTLTVRVTSNETCEVTNVAKLQIGDGTPIESNPVSNPIIPQPNPAGAHAKGSAVAVDLKSKGIINALLNGLLNPFGVNSNSLVIARTSSSQNGLGGPVATSDGVLSANVNGILSAGLLNTTAASVVSPAPAQARQTSTAEVANLCLVPVGGVCTVKVDAVRAVASTLATGSFAGVSSAGSTIVGLRVLNVLSPVDLNQTTKIPLNKAIFGANSYVAINERVSSAGLQGNTYAADLTVNMIHLKITGVLFGLQAIDLIVSQAVAHSDFPKTFVCEGSRHQQVSGHAFVASLDTNVLLADLTQGYVEVAPLGGAESEHVAQVIFPAADGAGLRAKVADSGTAGLITGSSASARSWAEVAGDGAAPLCLINDAGCIVKGSLIRAEARSLAGGVGSASVDTGTAFVDLRVLGIPIAGTPAPNTTINLPGIGFIILNEQFCDNTGPAVHTCVGATHSGITVRGVRIVITLLNKLLKTTPGIELIVAEAHADSTYS